MESSSDGSSSLGNARRMDSDVERMTAKHVWNREDIACLNHGFKGINEALN